MIGYKPKRIGLWGGSFNPPTLAHKYLADFAFSTLKLDEMDWIVCPHNPEKEAMTLAPFAHRFAMTEQVINDRPLMHANDIEQVLGNSYTLNTVRALRQKHPDDFLFFLMGADNWLEYHLWDDDYTEIFKFVSIAVMVRPGYKRLEEAQASKIFADIKVDGPEHLKKSGTFCFIENPPIDMAATRVRAALARGENSDQISDDTARYIRENALYGSKS